MYEWLERSIGKMHPGTIKYIAATLLNAKKENFRHLIVQDDVSLIPEKRAVRPDFILIETKDETDDADSILETAHSLSEVARLIDLEFQSRREDNLPDRVLHLASTMVVYAVWKGDDYSQVSVPYIDLIFIYDFKVFGSSRMEESYYMGLVGENGKAEQIWKNIQLHFFSIPNSEKNDLEKGKLLRTMAMPIDSTSSPDKILGDIMRLYNDPGTMEYRVLEDWEKDLLEDWEKDLLAPKEKENQILRAEIQKGQAEIQKQKAEIQKGKAEIQKGKAEIQKQKAEIQKQQAEIQKRQAEIQKGQAEIQKRKAEIQKQNKRIAELEAEIQKQNKRIAELEAEYQKLKNNQKD